MHRQILDKICGHRQSTGLGCVLASICIEKPEVRFKMLWMQCLFYCFPTALACTTVQETFGAMAKTEKINYILDQVRLCLDRKDFVRAQILAKKISPRAFAEAPKKEEKPGEKGIEGTTIEHPDEVRCQFSRCLVSYTSS